MSSRSFIQVGMGVPDVTIPIGMLLVKELKVTGSFRYCVRLRSSCDLFVS